MFLGKMDYEPNVNAVTRFCDGPFQKIKKELPDLKFLIVGARPSVSVKELEKIPGVSVTGFVESVLPYVQQAILVVAPMVSGSGIQTKVLEAMRHGKCVVATAKGADGLDNLRGGELRIVDEYSSLAEAVIELVNDGVMRMEIENRAKEYYASRYSFDIAKSRMLAYLEA
jgi:glycosyltransferase involved in cell wall biosynthesis